MRLFIGLPLSGAATENTAALAARAQERIPGRYVPAFNYHLTLAFLGEVSEQQLASAKSALDAFVARFPAPRMTLCGLSYFSRPSNAILIRTAECEDDLFSMRGALLDTLTAQALPFTDGPFSSHVTLARHADTTHTPPESVPFSPVRFMAPHAVLYLSARNEHNILRYTPLHSVPFRIFP